MVRVSSRQDQGTSGTEPRILIVYFSSVSENTHRFVQKLGGGFRIPLKASDPPLLTTQPYVLITPSYGAGRDQNTVPKQVIHFLNHETNRSLLRGVVGSGSTHYGQKYCRAAHVIAAKCNVPLLYTYEVLGLPEDVEDVRNIIRKISNESSTS